MEVFLGFCGFQKIAGTQVRCTGPFIEPTPHIPRFLSVCGAATRIVAPNPTFFAVFVRNRATSPFALFWSSCNNAIHCLCFLSSGGVGARFFFPLFSQRISDCVSRTASFLIERPSLFLHKNKKSLCIQSNPPSRMAYTSPTNRATVSPHPK